MRELKFRGWSIDDGKWCSRVDYDGYKERWTGIVEVTSPIEKDKYLGEYVAEPEKIIIEQYTGLKDKNGKEIYEGDIVEIYKGGRTYTVAWFEKDGGWFCFANDSDDYEPLYHTDFEVIGNIHENPELLEGNNGEEE